MTLPSLLKHIEHQRKLSEYYTDEKTKFLLDGMVENPVKLYSLEDYMLGGKLTDLFRFTCCLICGNPLNFRKMIDNDIS